MTRPPQRSSYWLAALGIALGCGDGSSSPGASAGGSEAYPAGGGSVGASSDGGASGAPRPSTGGSGGSEPASTGGGSITTGGTAGSDPTCALALSQGSAPTPLPLSGNTFAHDPTMIRVGETYYRFWTGNHVQRSTSSNLTTWSATSTVYPGTYPPWVSAWLEGVPGQTFNFPWAPDVANFGGRVHLYPSFSAKFGDNVSCITHLTTENVEGNVWTDHGPVICSEGTENYNAIDADVGLDVDGNAYLAFGSFWDGIFAFPLSPDGSRAGTTLTRLAWAPQIEAPVLFYRCGFYYLMVTWGLCCPGEGRSVDDLTYRVAIGRSDGILGPYVDRTGAALLTGGGTLVVEGNGTTIAAAGHSDVLVDGDKIYHLYHAYARPSGAASLRIVELVFDEEGWPLPHSP